MHKQFFADPKQGDLRIWAIPQVPSRNPFHLPVRSPEEAKAILNALAEYDLYQWKHRIKPDYSSVAGLEVFDAGEWTEWYDDDGNCIDEVADE
jgi:hypothetical protein